MFLKSFCSKTPQKTLLCFPESPSKIPHFKIPETQDTFFVKTMNLLSSKEDALRGSAFLGAPYTLRPLAPKPTPSSAQLSTVLLCGWPMDLRDIKKDIP